MRSISRALSAAFLLCAFSQPVVAPTYTPKTILFDAPPSVDTAGALHIAALPSGVPLTTSGNELLWFKAN